MADADARTDLELIAAMNGGEVTAFEALYRRYRDWVVRLAWRFCGDQDEALDVLQEVFSYFLRKFPGFVLTGKVTTFLYPAVRHTALHARRKRKRQPSLEAVQIEPGLDDAEPHARTRAELASVLAGLNPDQRETLLLRFVDGFSLKEIAEALEIPLGTVKSRLHKSLRQLRDDPRTREYFGQ
jgi:RNA polymerase sigma-70 factor (ECF subfamily)